jgi:hypothetical protein
MTEPAVQDRFWVGLLWGLVFSVAIFTVTLAAAAAVGVVLG